MCGAGGRLFLFRAGRAPARLPVRLHDDVVGLVGHLLEIKHLALAGALDLVQGGVGVGEQIRLGERLRQLGVVHDADGAGQVVALRQVVHLFAHELLDLLLVTLAGVQAVQHALHPGLGLVGAAVLHQEQELVAAPAADQVVRPAERIQQLGEPDQQLVADVVPEVVVVVLEVVEVDEAQRQAVVRRDLRDDVGEYAVELAAVVQARQHVGGAHPAQLLSLHDHDELRGELLGDHGDRLVVLVVLGLVRLVEAEQQHLPEHLGAVDERVDHDPVHDVDADLDVGILLELAVNVLVYKIPDLAEAEGRPGLGGVQLVDERDVAFVSGVDHAAVDVEMRRQEPQGLGRELFLGLHAQAEVVQQGDEAHLVNLLPQDVHLFLLLDQLDDLVEFVERHLDDVVSVVRLVIVPPAVGDLPLAAEELVSDRVGVAFLQVAEGFLAVAVVPPENVYRGHVEQDVLLRGELAELLGLPEPGELLEGLVLLLVFREDDDLDQVEEETLVFLDRHFVADVRASPHHLLGEAYLPGVGVRQRLGQVDVVYAVERHPPGPEHGHDLEQDVQRVQAIVEQPALQVQLRDVVDGDGDLGVVVEMYRVAQRLQEVLVRLRVILRLVQHEADGVVDVGELGRHLDLGVHALRMPVGDEGVLELVEVGEDHALAVVRGGDLVLDAGAVREGQRLFAHFQGVVHGQVLRIEQGLGERVPQHVNLFLDEVVPLQVGDQRADVVVPELDARPVVGHEQAEIGDGHQPHVPAGLAQVRGELGEVERRFEVRPEDVGVGDLDVRVAGVVGVVVALGLFVHQVEGDEGVLVLRVVQMRPAEDLVDELLVFVFSFLAELDALDEAVRDLDDLGVAEVVEQDLAALHRLLERVHGSRLVVLHRPVARVVERGFGVGGTHQREEVLELVLGFEPARRGGRAGEPGGIETEHQHAAGIVPKRDFGVVAAVRREHVGARAVSPFRRGGLSREEVLVRRVHAFRREDVDEELDRARARVLQVADAHRQGLAPAEQMAQERPDVHLDPELQVLDVRRHVVFFDVEAVLQHRVEHDRLVFAEIQDLRHVGVFFADAPEQLVDEIQDGGQGGEVILGGELNPDRLVDAFLRAKDIEVPANVQLVIAGNRQYLNALGL